ncbi:MAG: helix-turn-helix transcriptional regulator [Dysosmobacter sp.]|nr:helix-turn-helix transcriptional regulator [Dysosmobacter sp.]
MYYRLRDIREDRDLNQQTVARILHVSQATYSRYESGALDIPSPALIALADFYGVSTDYLLGRTDNAVPYPAPQKKERP